MSCLSFWDCVSLASLLYLASLCLSFVLSVIKMNKKQITTNTPTSTPQQKDKDELSVCVAWSLSALLLLRISLLSSSLSSLSSNVCVGCNNCLTLLSVLLFCSLTNLALTLSRLSLRRGIDKQQTREQRGGERKVGLRVGVEVCP